MGQRVLQGIGVWGRKGRGQGCGAWIALVFKCEGSLLAAGVNARQKRGERGQRASARQTGGHSGESGSGGAVPEGTARYRSSGPGAWREDTERWAKESMTVSEFGAGGNRDWGDYHGALPGVQ